MIQFTEKIFDELVNKIREDGENTIRYNAEFYNFLFHNRRKEMNCIDMDTVKTVKQLERLANLFDMNIDDFEDDDKNIYFYNLGLNRGIRMAINLLSEEKDYQEYVKNSIKDLTSGK